MMQREAVFVTYFWMSIVLRRKSQGSIGGMAWAATLLSEAIAGPYYELFDLLCIVHNRRQK